MCRVLAVFVVIVTIPLSASATTVTATVTTDVPGETRSVTSGVAGGTDYKFSYDPAGPCWSYRIDPSRLPDPAMCSPGFVEEGLGATTASCPNGRCSATNWMEAAHVAKVPWGCSGTATPWLPFKVRKCAARVGSTPLGFTPSSRSNRVRIHAVADTGERVEIRAHGSVRCEHPPAEPGAVIGPPPIAQNREVRYAPATGDTALSIASIVGLCTAIPFSSASITYTTYFLQGTSEVRGPAVVVNVTARSLMHNVELRLSGIDDDAYLWRGAPGPNARAVCAARYANNTRGQRSCNLTTIMSTRGVYSRQDFTLKFGNGGGWDSCGRVELWIDGALRWHDEVSCAVRHTGWFYRATLDVDFLAGKVRATARHCGLPTDCMD